MDATSMGTAKMWVMVWVDLAAGPDDNNGVGQGLKTLINDGKQDMIAQVVPIPAAAWLFGSALFGTVALGRRKQKKADA